MEQPRILQVYRSEIDLALAQFFQQEIRKTTSIGDPVQEILEVMRDFTLRGGKRIRPILVILGYRGAGGAGHREIIKASISFELLQSFLLIHDDIIDQDDLRRGEKTVHRAFIDKVNKKGDIGEDADHRGISKAIIAGDLCFAMSHRAIFSSGFRSGIKTRASQHFDRVAMTTLYGEILDCVPQPDFSREDIHVIHVLKTATYTTLGPLRMGAILAGASRQQMAAYTRYALPLGLAFQLKDDIMGMFGDQKTIGKPVGSDLKEGKKTLLFLKALEKADRKDKAFLSSCMGDKGLTSSRLMEAQRIIKDTGSLRHSEQLAEHLALQAKMGLKGQPITNEVKKTLFWLADFTISRRT